MNFLTGNKNKLIELSNFNYDTRSGPGKRTEENPPDTSESYSHEEPTDEKIKTFT